MKFKFNAKLTIALVSLFIGLLLIILGNKNKYCLSLGCLFFAGSLWLLCNERVISVKNEITAIDERVDEDDIEEEEYTILVNSKIKLTKGIKKTKLTFYTFAVLLAITAILVLI